MEELKEAWFKCLRASKNEKDREDAAKLLMCVSRIVGFFILSFDFVSKT